MNDTHGEFIQGEINGKRFTAFIDGVPDTCEHDSDGPVLSFNDAGEYFKDTEMPDYKTDPIAWEAFQKEHKINGGCVSCSKCGKPFTPDFNAF